MVFVAHRAGQALGLNLWPPSAAVTFATLPYLKIFYDSIYERMFGKLEQSWIAEVQPHQLNMNDGNALPVHLELDRPKDDNGILMTIDSEGNTGNLPDIILGGLAFPAISTSMGGLLKDTLVLYSHLS
ncbi:hypothetical protein BO85DRAFT_492861 [Aspergillus piperis CBS 112811]|uniref:Uncharacterized protein n=1 Tax=Aspergillus piperis CBS 112811 TaxID=1448313 RepID=A0A8G1QTV5_9EURO|nr:hypothetical protein BO85DRAFT_492861 [Aspergillus piperis CBS 112811]RAH52737.1 hypothetical protein BO85DRAFT_492861 [Aspergillus piperis CBS 112811]